ncbi:MAG: hypothetical protein RL662_1464 [Bacteroidota bacterium]|jgi:hypothetical protein
MKSDKKDPIRNMFASRLNGFEPELPASIWEKINSDLDMHQTPQHQKKRMQRILWSVASVAAMLVGVLFFYNPDTTNSDSITVAEHSSSSSTSNNNVDQTYKLQTTQKELIAQQQSEKSNTPSRLTVAYAEHKSQKETLQALYKGEETISTLAEASHAAEEKKEQVIDIIRSDEAFEKDLADKIASFEKEGERFNTLFADNVLVGKEQPENKGLEIGFGGGGGFSKAVEMQNQLRLSTTIVDEENYNTPIFKNQKMRLDHNQPITFGFAVSKKISTKVSVESGITYTYLSSKIKSTENTEKYLKDSQQLHYLGIPLAINYHLGMWHNIQFYASAGGAIQKDIYGTIRTNENLGESIEIGEYYTKKISQKKPQLSTNLSLGASYPIYNKLSIYSNIGGVHYFETQNEYETIYSDRKWMLNINLGLKLGF